ncbi:hypothetical protein [Halobellus captivus]|uniref:hypothetical protein n=1 Tax=Halobellus captivus TaxID=2592614 RepID=UPI001EEF9937|nr:hypothetical protein [Halobellus captivus]
MDSPPRDDSIDDGDASGDSVDRDEPTVDSDDSVSETGNSVDDSNDPVDNSDESAGTHDPGIGRRDASRSERVDPPKKDFDDPIGDLLPRASVDSRWWYWIAAIPLYVVLVGFLAVLFLGAFIFDLFLTGGIATVFGAFVVVPVLGLLGLALSVMYPIATYVDARAIAESDASWTPDPLVWGLAALATEVLSAFTLSVVLALYYLYKRHVAVGTP